ncbi:MAG TPA: oligoendopeptidase F [Syntrophomonadaceae bacterium]|nr:oligoendopeptidase F [Syntrophomonadaceae bacterium]HPR93892.1 oligoendopeptidase F [Syntrophomonadaceae bacterium]
MENTKEQWGENDKYYHWQLEDIYDDEQKWEEDYRQVQQMSIDLTNYQGKLGGSDAGLFEALSLMENLERKADNVYVYAKMRQDEDNTNSLYQSLFDRAESLAVQASSAAAFIVPEILSIPDEVIKKYLKENKKLEVYTHYLDELNRQKQHILSPAEEKLLAETAELSIASKNIFGMLNNADIKFPPIKDENGQETEMTKGKFGRFMESPDREVRKAAFKSLYSSYGKLKNTLGATVNASVKRDIFYSRARKYPSALAGALESDNISPAVYKNLIDTVHKNLEPMYKYLRLRKKILGLDELHMYDIYTPLVKERPQEIAYETAKDMVSKGLQPLGKEYGDKIGEGFNGGWIDVYEKEGKTSGAYSWGSYDTHPFILMNYDNKLDDVFTLAHELGHAMHSFYSNHAQPYIYSQYSIFLAEVASTVNESLLIDHLLADSKKQEDRIYLINHYLEQFKGTMYRQTMFAEFEKITHETVERGAALTPELLSSIYRELNKLYFGGEVVLDEEIDLEWARIPHFYSAFYVYKYATGFAAATALKDQLLKEGKPALDRYMAFLQAGSSDYSINILQKAGVDLNTPEPVEAALKYFSRLVDELETLID